MSDEKITFETDSAGFILYWEIPRGQAAEAKRSLSERIDYYIATQSLKVDDLVFIPKRETVQSILTAWDLCKAHLAVETNTYSTYSLNNQ